MRESPRLLLAAVALVGATRLGGSSADAGERTGGWRPPHEAELPEGFPAPAEPGRIQLKWYPAWRGAFVRIEGSLRSASFRGFWPLFRHIQGEGIAMTAPVLSQYEAGVRSEDRGSVEMAFLYPRTSLGTAGPTEDGVVAVVDAPPLCVVSVGVEGPYDLATLRSSLARLEEWLAENRRTWRAAGPPRRLAYQQPLPFKRLYSEVQVPVEPVPLTP